jgi:uncharacterized membrane protein YhaH (DUF805 family)
MDIDEPLYTRNPSTSSVKGPFARSDVWRAFQAGELGRNVEVKTEAESAWVRLLEHPAFRASEGEQSSALAEPARARRASRLDRNNPYATLGEDEGLARSGAPSWLDLLFSFRGRFPRRLYWGTRVLAVLPVLVAGIVAGATQRGSANADPNANAGGLVLIVLPAYVASLWIMLAGSVKRWHDRDKSGWWLLIAMVPLVGGLWELIEAGCARGTHGPNRYGEDPT